MFNVKWYFEGAWAVQNPDNRVHMYVNHYRSGALVRAHLVAVSNNNHPGCFLSGERTFLTHSSAFGEEAIWDTDDFLVEIANQGAENINIGIGQVEMRFILAQ